MSETLDGRFHRQPSHFTDRITADGSSGFPAESGRYHLIVSLACPWAHRALLVRRLRRLEEAVSLAVVDPIRDERGWRFSPQVDERVGFAETVSLDHILRHSYRTHPHLNPSGIVPQPPAADWHAPHGRGVAE